MTRIRDWTLGAGIMTVCAALGATGCGTTTRPTIPAAPAALTHVKAPARQSPEQRASAKVPAGASAVTLSVNRAIRPRVRRPAPVTVTGPATVERLAALVDGLPPFPDGAYSCPMDDGASLVLTFSAGRGGPVLAVATMSLSGCQGVGLTVGGRQQPGLGTPAGGRSDAARALRIAGLGWRLPG